MPKEIKYDSVTGRQLAGQFKSQTRRDAERAIKRNPWMAFLTAKDFQDLDDGTVKESELKKKYSKRAEGLSLSELLRASDKASGLKDYSAANVDLSNGNKSLPLADMSRSIETRTKNGKTRHFQGGKEVRMPK